MQELRDIATTEPVKGKHFFLETDMKGPALKLDNTGKAILTVSAFIYFAIASCNFNHSLQTHIVFIMLNKCKNNLIVISLSLGDDICNCLHKICINLMAMIFHRSFVTLGASVRLELGITE